APRQVELKVVPRILCKRRINRPKRKRLGEHVGCPGNGCGQEKLTNAQRSPWRPQLADGKRRRAAPQAKADQKYSQDDRKRIDGSPDEQRKEPRPDDFSTDRGKTR